MRRHRRRRLLYRRHRQRPVWLVCPRQPPGNDRQNTPAHQGAQHNATPPSQRMARVKARQRRRPCPCCQGPGMPLRRLPQRMLRSAQGPVIVLPAHRRGEHVVRLIDACGRVVRPSPTATREIRVGQTHQHAVVLAQRGRVRSRRQAHQRVVVRTGPQHRGAHEKTGRLAHLGPKRLVLRHAFRRSAAGQDEHFGAVVEQQARLPHRQRITTRKRLKIEQAGTQRRPPVARRVGHCRLRHAASLAMCSSRPAIQAIRGRRTRRTCPRPGGFRIAIAVIAFIAIV